MTVGAIAAFGQVVAIDLVLAGDNAIVIGTIASGLGPARQRAVVAVGVAAAAVLRIAFALVAVVLLGITGLPLVGGLLLLWVAWRMFKDLEGSAPGGAGMVAPAPKSFARAVAAVCAADVGMSLDNVMGVAGAAQGHPVALAFGLILSIALMGVAASVIARVMGRHRWIGYIGLALIIFIAAGLIWGGAMQIIALTGEPS